MKLLVLATNYPKKENIASTYVHTRNKYYVQNNIDVTVLNFKATEGYEIDGVKVITKKDYVKKQEPYDILVSHAPNLRNHYVFLKKYANNFPDIVFFFHGHEVLKTSEIYPEPYKYMHKSSKISFMIRDKYDLIKLNTWNKYFTNNLSKLHFVFVSQWMYDKFLKFVKMNPDKIKERTHIIYNSVGEKFETEHYLYNSEKLYDFITIRNNLDGSKYAIDIVAKIAMQNPYYKFCVIGKGNFFKYNKTPSNLEWIDKTLSHNEVINYLNKSRCALMPTRTDAQGVMACEMATFGIPVITSNLDVCKEVFYDFKNVQYIDNSDAEINIELIFQKLKRINLIEKNTRFFSKNTAGKEICMFKKIKDGKK